MIRSTPPTNIIVPLVIESLAPGPSAATLKLGLDLISQYYKNADIEYRVSHTAALKIVHLPIYTSLQRRDGVWKEIYDQDRHFQRIGEVIKDPDWKLSPNEQRMLASTTIEAEVEMQFYDFVEGVRDKYLGSHDVVLELTGKSFVQKGYPKEENGIVQYGTVDFEVLKFDAIYIVPKGGPTGSRLLS